MAYIKKKGVSSKSKAENLPYKGVGVAIEKLPYRGTNESKMTPLKKEAKRKAASSTSGIGAKVTKTNRATGETTTEKKTLTPMAKSKVARPLAKRNSGATTKTLSTTGTRKLKNELY